MALKQDGVHFSFVLNRVRVSNPQRLIYTQILVEYPPEALDHELFPLDPPFYFVQDRIIVNEILKNFALCEK